MTMTPSPSAANTSPIVPTRRGMLHGLAGGVAALAASAGARGVANAAETSASPASPAPAKPPAPIAAFPASRPVTVPAEQVPPPEYRASKGNIRQSIMGWCFNGKVPVDQLAKACKAMGIVAMEGVGAEHYPMITGLGLSISLVGSHGFAKGPTDKANHAAVAKALRDGVDKAVAFKCDKVITFTGMLPKGMDRAEAERNCLEGWKQALGYAEEKKVTLCLEHLNSRDHGHPMKGHPGYFGDNVDYCVELINKVGSPNFKLLFDIYHVQIMNGDVIRRLRQYKDVVAHVHTAGNPGRAELDDQQEINYPAIMRTLVDLGYPGFVAQEFIPTWPDALAALRHAVKVCDA